MKKLMTLAATAGAVALFACGGDDSVNNSPGPDASTDTGGGDGSNGKDGSADGSGNDSGGDGSIGMDSGTMDAAMGDAGILCTKPSDCGNNQVCCGTLVTGAGNPPICPVNSFGTACKAANMCMTNIQFACSTTDTVRACTQSSQCNEQAYPMCCTFTANMQSETFCVDQTIANFAASCN